MPPDLMSSPLEHPDVPATSAALQALWARGAAFLGTRYALMGGAMSWVSERNLVSAISNAGGFGVDRLWRHAAAAAGARELPATQAMTDRPFGVNLITMHPALDELIAVCIRAGVGHVVLGGRGAFGGRGAGPSRMVAPS